jgi:hypothetical protein
MNGEKGRGDDSNTFVYRQRQKNVYQNDASDMRKNVYRAESEWVHPADMESNILQKPRHGKTHSTGKNAGKISNIFIFQKTVYVVGDETVSKRISIGSYGEKDKKRQDKPIFAEKIKKTK